MEMQIPRIIHQIWHDPEIPAPFKILQQTWKQHHLEWEYRCWNAQMNFQFIKSHFPWFLSTYEKYEKDIERYDAARYFILLKYGGLYVDMDFECLKDITPLLVGEHCVLTKEPLEHYWKEGKNLLLSNAWMASMPGHPFMKAVCEGLSDASRFYKGRMVDVLFTTGPHMLTDLYRNFPDKEDVRLLEPEMVCPLSLREVRMLFKEEGNEHIYRKIVGAYAIHYWLGTWTEDNMLGSYWNSVQKSAFGNPDKDFNIRKK